MSPRPRMLAPNTLRRLLLGELQPSEPGSRDPLLEVTFQTRRGGYTLVVTEIADFRFAQHQAVLAPVAEGAAEHHVAVRLEEMVQDDMGDSWYGMEDAALLDLRSGTLHPWPVAQGRPLPAATDDTMPTAAQLWDRVVARHPQVRSALQWRRAADHPSAAPALRIPAEVRFLPDRELTTRAVARRLATSDRESRLAALALVPALRAERARRRAEIADRRPPERAAASTTPPAPRRVRAR